MKTSFFLTLGLLLSLSLNGLGLNSQEEELSQSEVIKINEEMNQRFLLRDSFKEKGNSRKYLRVHSPYGR